MAPHSLATRISGLVYLSLALAIGACNDSTGPRPTPGAPGLHIVAGGGTTDTVAAILPQAIVAEVRDARGNPMPGVVVHFDALPVDSAHPYNLTAYVRRIQDQFITASAVDTTDGNGRARVQVALGPIAGPVSVVVHVDAEPGADTVRRLPSLPVSIVAALAAAARKGVLIRIDSKTAPERSGFDPTTYSRPSDRPRRRLWVMIASSVASSLPPSTARP